MIGLESVMDKSIGCFLPQKVMSVVLAKYFLSMMVLGLMILSSLKSLKNGANKFYQGIVVTSLLI